MALCKNCARSGMFLSVDSNSLCGSCSPFIIMDIQQKGRLVQDCMRLVDNSKNLDVQLSRYEFLMENLRGLLHYEQKTISTISPLPSFLIGQYEGKRDRLVIDHLTALFDAAKSKAPVGSSAKSIIGRLNKVLMKLRDHQQKLQAKTAIARLERSIVDEIHRVQFEGYLEAAKKAEFKRQKKKALDQYYEALYFLRHDEIDDTFQSEHIAKIEAKISELGGTVEAK